MIFFHFVQGIGAAAVMVIPRAIIRDLHTGTEATRLNGQVAWFKDPDGNTLRVLSG